MKKDAPLMISLFCAILVGGTAIAAPLPREQPANISGTIAEAKWFPAKSLRGIPGMSGSAGHDRTVAAHFLVTLKNYDGISSATAKRISFYVRPAAAGAMSTDQPTVQLQLNHEDREYLKSGMRIRVKGYQIAGDEGGTWTRFSAIEILSQPQADRPPER